MLHTSANMNPAGIKGINQRRKECSLISILVSVSLMAQLAGRVCGIMRQMAPLVVAMLVACHTAHHRAWSLAQDRINSHWPWHRRKCHTKSALRRSSIRLRQDNKFRLHWSTDIHSQCNHSSSLLTASTKPYLRRYHNSNLTLRRTLRRTRQHSLQVGEDTVDLVEIRLLWTRRTRYHLKATLGISTRDE